MPTGQNRAAGLEVLQFPCLEDNYGYLVRDPVTGTTAAVDTPDAGAIEAALARKGWQLDFILNTHHHGDHAGGNLALKERTGCRVVGARGDAARIPGIDVRLGEGETFELGSRRARVLETPGHTRGHIVYVFDEDRAAFVGDTLFAMGCGRLFEGTPAEMWDSLQKLLALPDDTRVYCAHEYTQKNARFALTVEPGNAELVARAAEVDRLRANGLPTVPTTIGRERATNPFMRPGSANLRATLGLAGASDVEVLAETRRRRNAF
jgi:hydroxyacylglutathione hydrolase